jgi:DNA gyrase subunit B
MIVRYGEGAAKLEGPGLSKFASGLKEYFGFFDKVNKRLRDEKITELLPRLDLSKRADFEGEKKAAPKKIEKLEKELKKLQKERDFKSIETRFDEEHNLWEVKYVNSQGAEHLINWELASTAEYRQLLSKFKQVEPYMEPPFVIEAVGDASDSGSSEEEAGAEEATAEAEDAGKKKAPKPAAKKKAVETEVVEKTNARDLFEYIKEAGSRGYDKTRYKGLGEMNSEQLWQTTMDPERRTLLSVKLEDLAECETIFSTLMGEDVEARRKFIEDNALDVKNLDI